MPEVLKEKPGFKDLGFIRSGLDDLKAWCRAQQPTEKPTVSSYARGRFEKWFEHEFKLTTPVEVILAERYGAHLPAGTKALPREA